MRESAVKLLKLLYTQLCAHRVGRAGVGNRMGPGALRRSGALFAVSETSGMLQILIRRRNAWPSRPGTADVVNDVWNALPLWHMGRRWAFDPVRPGSLLLVRRSHGYPDFLPLLGDGAAVASSSRLPVHDDAMRLSPGAETVKSQFTSREIGDARKQRRFARGFGRRDRRHVDDAARGH